MKKIFLIFALITQVLLISAQENRSNLAVKIDTTNFDFRSFAENICQHNTSSLERAKTLLHFVSNTLQWLPNDYEQRTVKEILARGGGNCFELAKVYMKFIKVLDIKYRPIAEINIHPISENRLRTARKKVAQIGNRMSVFGRQHNDHRWVEIYDESTTEWIPVDPTMNVFGVTEWLKARAWFGSRVTIDTTITNAMIVPFAVFVNNSAQNRKWESRTAHYLIDELDNLYNNELSRLSAWDSWTALIKNLDEPARLAFEGKVNLHSYSKEIDAVERSYQLLKKEYKDQN
jgi:hypothetical protein